MAARDHERRISVHRADAASLAVLLGTIVSCAFSSAPTVPSRRIGRPGTPLVHAVSIYLGHTLFGLNYTALGSVFGCDRTTVRRSCHRIENRRDETGFDAALNAIEPALFAWITLFGVLPASRFAIHERCDGDGARS